MNRLFSILFWAGTLVLLNVTIGVQSVKRSTISSGVDLCDRPSTDPCVPGGKWDPLLNRCHGIRGQSCYQCYSGQFCQEVNNLEDCLLQSLDGDPVVLSEYWSTVKTPCLQTPADYRPAYQFEVLPPVEEAIRQLHITVNNADTEDYSIVYGVGATNVLFMTITAMSRNILNECTKAGRTDCPPTVDVYVQTPYYFGYLAIVDMVSTAKWNPQANTSSEFTIEIVTHPNNPNGELRKPMVQDKSHVMYDMVYYWPMYTNTSVMMSEDIMIFSASKHCGLAGTRFGWGLFKDPSLADQVNDIKYGTIVAVSEDSMLRTYNTISQVLGEIPSPVTGMLPYHQFGREKIFTAFSHLSEAIKDCKGMNIQLTNDITHSPGAYAWLKCTSGVQCADELKALAGIEGTPGVYYGATNETMRLSMFMPSVEMDIMIKKFSNLCH